MKKILIVLFLILFMPLYCCAEDRTLTFLYINGSNNNDEKMKNWYEKGVRKLHPVLKKKFEKNPQIKRWSAENHVKINDEPQIFFWGYDSKTDLEFVKERINLSKVYTAIFAYEVRSLLTQFLHDAIWIQKEHNMLPVLDELNNQIKKDENQNVILYGYSAGTFVTYQYLIYKIPYIKLEYLFNALSDDEMSDFARKYPREDTCLSAIMHNKGNLGVLSNNGHLVLNQNKTELKQNYLNIDTATKLYCAPKGKVKGVVNFASPLPLFYSDLGDKNYELNFYTKYMFKYIMENGMFFLTVNFREDPLGFPSSQNFTLRQYEKLTGITFKNPKGVIYDNSKVWSRRSALLAHTSYWSARNVFAKAVVQSFVNGSKYLYDDNYQKRKKIKLDKKQKA